MKQKRFGTAILFGGMVWLAAASGFRKQEEPAAPVLFDTCSEYLILSALENELALMAQSQSLAEQASSVQNLPQGQQSVPKQEEAENSDDTSGLEITGFPEYVTNYPNLYAPEASDGQVSDEETENTGEEIENQGEEIDKLGDEQEGEKNVIKKIAYLSFDDGPSEETIKVLDILKEEGIHATFFLIGEEITPEREDIVRRIVEEGHTIGLHTYCHDYTKMYHSVDAFLEDYEKVYQRIYEVTGKKPVIFRFPGGSKNKYVSRIAKEVIKEMERRGFCYYDWNVSAEDSVGRPTAYSIRANIFKDVFRFEQPVILMHDSAINKVTISCLPDIIKEIRKAGYEFDTLDHRECCQF